MEKPETPAAWLSFSCAKGQGDSTLPTGHSTLGKEGVGPAPSLKAAAPTEQPGPLGLLTAPPPHQAPLNFPARDSLARSGWRNRGLGRGSPAEASGFAPSLGCWTVDSPWVFRGHTATLPAVSQERGVGAPLTETAPVFPRRRQRRGGWVTRLEGLRESAASSFGLPFLPASAPIPGGARALAAPTPFQPGAVRRGGRLPAPRGAARDPGRQPRVRAGVDAGRAGEGGGGPDAGRRVLMATPPPRQPWPVPLRAGTSSCTAAQ